MALFVKLGRFCYNNHKSLYHMKVSKHSKVTPGAPKPCFEQQLRNCAKPSTAVSIKRFLYTGALLCSLDVAYRVDSEYRLVYLGGTWLESRHMCNEKVEKQGDVGNKCCIITSRAS